MAEPFIGEIRMFTCDYAPEGWAFCDGSLLEISQNPSLFSIISTLYGGDGRRTMGLPNLQGRSPMGVGRGPGLTDRRIASSSGASYVVLNEQQIPEHKHQVTAVKSNGAATNPEGQYLSKMKNNSLYNSTAANPAAMSLGSIQHTGNSRAHENKQPCLTVNFCIALVGVYPARS